MCVACAWHVCGMRMACIVHALGIHLARTAHACMHARCTCMRIMHERQPGVERGSHNAHARAHGYACAMHVLCMHCVWRRWEWLFGHVTESGAALLMGEVGGDARCCNGRDHKWHQALIEYLRSTPRGSHRVHMHSVHMHQALLDYLRSTPRVHVHSVHTTYICAVHVQHCAADATKHGFTSMVRCSVLHAPSSQYTRQLIRARVRVWCCTVCMCTCTWYRSKRVGFFYFCLTTQTVTTRTACCSLTYLLTYLPT